MRQSGADILREPNEKPDQYERQKGDPEFPGHRGTAERVTRGLIRSYI